MPTLTEPAGHRAQDGLRAEGGWRALANCSGTATDVFYPEGRGRTLRAREARAKEFCRHCPVTTQCREAAAILPERFGIWGGLTPGERGWSPSGQPRRAAS